MIELNELPDWIQAFGATIASLGLIYTLILQQKTLKEQQVITKLEQKKFLDSNLPILQLENIEYLKQGQYRKVIFDVVISENNLQNLTIGHNFEDNFTITMPYYVKDVVLSKGYKFSFNIEFTLSPVFTEITEYSGNTIWLNFEDKYGNKYEQYIIYKGSDLVFLQPSFRR
ncbi:hypothetical protein [Elizabethkingia anophelis]|uniref:hypothetical protein n=1 Tax=Elizabethkingia anophelis TaxID=1117645 RepID=UPI0038911A1C